VTRAETRAAVVTGSVRVTVPGLPGGGGEVVLTAAGSAADALAHQQDRCRPARG
jgi:hypothetical protein